MSRIRESEKNIKEFHSMKNLVWKNVRDTSFSGSIKKTGTRDLESTVTHFYTEAIQLSGTSATNKPFTGVTEFSGTERAKEESNIIMSS